METDEKDIHKHVIDCCWYCGGVLCWDSDYDYSDIYGEGEGIVTMLHCTQCGAEVEYTKKEEENENE